MRIVSLAVLLAGAAGVAFGGEPELDKARDAIVHGRYEEGLKALDAILAKPSEKTERDARKLRVQGYLETGKYKEAIAEAGQLTKVEREVAPDDPDALALHATTLIETGQYDEAAKLLARALERDNAHLKARVLTFELAELTGKKDVSNAQVAYFLDLYAQGKAKGAEALTCVGRAVEKEDPKGAWRAYQEAQQADANCVDAFVYGGFHCLEKYAWPLARQCFEKALKINPNLAIAHVGFSVAHLASGNYDGATKSIESALKVNPKLGLAHLLRASMLAVEEKNAESLAAIRAALDVNPNDLRALSMFAAHYEGVGNAAERDKAIGQVLKTHPKYPELYTTLGEACERLRRCPAAIEWAKKAIGLDPDFWRGYYVAGMNLLRAGEEQEGYQLLDEAFKRNAFNVWAYNTLNVLDRDLKKKEFVYHETPHFLVKLDKSEDAILWPYLERLIEPLYDRMARKYDVQPVGPKQYGGRTLVLLFPKHEEFSARTMGLPGLSALGACLGQVITMPSPRLSRTMPSGGFNWRQVLIHEFAHVLTLQKTDYKIPRWLTEGLSVAEEEDTRVNWDAMLAQALAKNQLLSLEDLNSGFTRPKFPNQVPLSYYQGYLICRHLQETYGFEAIAKMLALYREGKPTTEVLPKVTGKTMKQLNDDCMAYIRRYAEQIKMSIPPDKDALAKLEEQAKKDDKNADLWAQIASGRFAARKIDDARKAAKRAVELNPKLPRPHAILGLIAQEHDKDIPGAKQHFARAKEADPNYFFAHFYLAQIAEKEGNTEETINELEAARKLYPRFHQPGKSIQERLADLYVKGGKNEKAIEVLRELAGLYGANPRVFITLGDLLARQKQPTQAAAAYLEAIYIDPYDPQLHLAAARVYDAADAVDDALREYAVAAAIERKHLDTLISRAQAFAVAGRAGDARKAIAAIRRIDPDNPEAAKIESLLKK